MSRSPFFDKVSRSVRFALLSKQEGLSPREAVERRSACETAYEVERRDRRVFLAEVGNWLYQPASPRPGRRFPRPVLLRSERVFSERGHRWRWFGGTCRACADQLAADGIGATLYEASGRVGGRQWSLRGFFPGQVAERGGEFIDNLHKTMLGYAKRFGLAREDVGQDPRRGDLFPGRAASPRTGGGRGVPRVCRDHAHQDLRRLSQPTADAFNDHDLRLDNTSLQGPERPERQPASPPERSPRRRYLVEAYEADVRSRCGRAERSEFPVVHSCGQAIEVSRLSASSATSAITWWMATSAIADPPRAIGPAFPVR